MDSEKKAKPAEYSELTVIDFGTDAAVNTPSGALQLIVKSITIPLIFDLYRDLIH